MPLIILNVSLNLIIIMSNSKKVAANAVKNNAEVNVENNVEVTANEIVKVKVVSVDYIDATDRVKLKFDKMLPTYEKNEETDVYEETESNQFEWYASALTAQLCQHDDDIAYFRACFGKFKSNQFGLLLMKATLDIEIEKVAEGEEFTAYDDVTKVAERDQFIRRIVKVKLADRAKKQIDKYLDNALAL